jgi:hypothetical protein
LRFGGNFLGAAETKSSTTKSSSGDEGGVLLKKIMDSLRVWGKPVWYEPGDKFDLPEFGMKIYFLGPSRSLPQLGASAPGKAGRGMQFAALGLPLNQTTSFLAAAVKNANLQIDSEDDLSPTDIDDLFRLSLPFDQAYSMKIEDARESDVYCDFLKRHYGFEGENGDAPEWRRINTDWLHNAAQLALQQVSNVNLTSLVMAIELTDSGKVMLFAADAEVESWETWGEKCPTLDELFRHTVLYKVGHHGSVNATWIDGGLSKMTDKNLVALIPVDKVRATANEWIFPDPNVYSEINKRTRQRIILNCIKECQNCEPQFDEKKFGTKKVTKDQSKDRLWVEYSLMP